MNGNGQSRSGQRGGNRSHRENFGNLYAEIEHLELADERLRKDVEVGFASVNSRLDDISRAISVARAPNYSALAVLITFASVIGVLIWHPLQGRLEKMEQHTSKEGHPETVIAKIEALEKKLDTESEASKREADLRFKWTNERIDRIDYFGSSRWRTGMEDEPRAIHPLEREW